MTYRAFPKHHVRQTRRLAATKQWLAVAMSTLLLVSSVVAGLPFRAHAAGTYELVSGGTTGQPDFANNTAQLSADGRYVLFRSKATNILPGDTNDVADQYLYDRQTHTTVLVSTNANGTIAN